MNATKQDNTSTHRRPLDTKTLLNMMTKYNSNKLSSEESSEEKQDYRKLVSHYQSQGLSDEAAYARASRVRLQAHLAAIAETESPSYAAVVKAAGEWQELTHTGIEQIPLSKLPAPVREHLEEVRLAATLPSGRAREGVRKTGGSMTITFGDKEAEKARRMEHRARWERARRRHVEETWSELHCDGDPLTTNRLLLEIMQSLKDMSYWLAFYYPNGKLPKIQPKPTNK